MKHESATSPRMACCGEWDSLVGQCSDCPHAGDNNKLSSGYLYDLARAAARAAALDQEHIAKQSLLWLLADRIHELVQARVSETFKPYDQAALDEASREVHMMLLREGSSWGTKACEEMGRVFMTAYLKALPSATRRVEPEDMTNGEIYRDGPHEVRDDKHGDVIEHLRKMRRSCEEGEMYSMASECTRVIAMLTLGDTPSATRLSEEHLIVVAALSPRPPEYLEDSHKAAYESGFHSCRSLAVHALREYVHGESK